MSRTVAGQLVKYLLDAHSIEEQALVQLRRAPQLAGDADVARIFRGHLAETWDHERAVRDALAARGASLVTRILTQERAAAGAIREGFDRAAALSLQAVGA